MAEKPPSSSSLNAKLLGITWLTSAALIGYLAYQQWTFGQTDRGTALDVSIADRAALAATATAVSALVHALLGAFVVWRPTRRLLTLSAVWAAANVALGVLQILGLLKLGSNAVGDVVILATIAMAAGLQSFVARQDMPETVQATRDSGPPPPVAIAESPPQPVVTAPPPTITEVAPRARPFAPPPPVQAPPVTVVGGHVIIGRQRPATSSRSRRSWSWRDDRTSPVLVFVALVSGFLALAVVGYALLAPDGGLLAGLSPTPSPAPAPTPAKTIRPVTAAPFMGTAPMTFGVEFDPDSLAIRKPATRFNVGVKDLAWNAELLQPAGTRALIFRFIRVSKGGAEEILESEEIPLDDPTAEVVAGAFDVASAAKQQPGTYVVRLVRADDVMAEGTLTLVK